MLTARSIPLDAPLTGRFFVRGASGRLVAEVQKTSTGRAIELGLEAGVYRVAFTERGVIWVLVTDLPSGHKVVLQRNIFTSDGLVVANRDRGASHWPDDDNDGWEGDELPPGGPPWTGGRTIRRSSWTCRWRSRSARPRSSRCGCRWCPGSR